MKRINIAGAGLAGLSAALTLAKKGIGCNLISVQPSERAQSVLAEGGMNAALDTMGEQDSPTFHYEDTMKGGVYLADPNAVRGLTSAAPEIIRRLHAIGVPFQMKDGELVLRPFGGQKKRRTAYAMSSTGKVAMTALIDEVRRFEASGLIRRYPHMEILSPAIEENRCTGLLARDTFTGECFMFRGPVILCTGGMNGLFSGMTTGSTANTGDVTAAAFVSGAALGNLEMIQYHPTTMTIPGKRLLVSEAARGEGGRLFVERTDPESGRTENWYFMEEKYPELGNLMPRDVVSREMSMVTQDPSCGSRVYLDMRHLSRETWEGKLADLRKEVIHYLQLDPAADPLPVSPGIHFFMGGILVDEQHRTSVADLWAAGECACQYHGANRLGGNSMIAAVYGGHVAAENAAEMVLRHTDPERTGNEPDEADAVSCGKMSASDEAQQMLSPAFAGQVQRFLAEGLPVFRSEENMQKALQGLEDLWTEALTEREKRRLLLARAILLSALSRRESRGAHTRTDYPERDDKQFRKTTAARFVNGEIQIGFQEIPKDRQEGEE
ncbi:MAG: FAD-binding protein [Blautia sp.]|nr:FAD-binding protein [Blautia sp.]